MSNPEHTPNRVDLKSHQEEIRKQIESNTVVLYNLKDNKAFYAITPEEARFAIDAIKERRENHHYCQIVPLKDQSHWKKNYEKYNSDNGLTIYCQQISNLQVGMQDYYAQVSVPRRGSIAYEDSIGEIFDIAVNPRKQVKATDGIKKGFLAILREKLFNDLTAYRCMLEKLLIDGKITKEEKENLKLEDWEMAVKILYGCSAKAIDSKWNDLSKEEKKKILERMMKEDEEDYKQIEKMVQVAMKDIKNVVWRTKDCKT
jgi:hypothetical protein